MVSLQLLLVLLTASNLIVYLHASYVGTPTVIGDVNAVLKRTLELKCAYTGDDVDGEFVGWYKDGIAVSTEKPGHYLVTSTEKESKLLIQILVEADADVKNWYVKTKKSGHEEPPACRFGRIELKPSPQSIQTNRTNEIIESAHGSVARNAAESVLLRCIVEPKPTTIDPKNTIQWEFSKDDHAFSNTLPDGIIVKDNEITIDHVKKSHRGYYRCKLNDVSFTVLLRVKDRLAALWPFIGIVSVVLVLVVVILIFEKRHKANKKLIITDDDEEDQPNDPLVRTTTKASDNENKKRAVKT